MSDKNEYWINYVRRFKREASKRNFDTSYVDTCLKYAENLHFKNLPIIFDGTHLSHLVGYDVAYLYGTSNDKEQFYRKYKIPKRNGKTRQIVEPLPSLKEIQRWVLDKILIEIPAHATAKAYIKGRSVYDNARFHKGQSLVLKMDIKNFFPSITPQYINSVFKRCGYSAEVAKLLTELVTYRKGLPQGAPTSPALSNIIMYKADKRLFGYARSKNLRYTRYADDITISGDFDPAEVISFVSMVIEETGFKVNKDKTAVLRQSARQVVTGVVCNEKLQAPKAARKKIRQELYYIKKYGLDSHLSKEGIAYRNYVPHLLGRANYILQINPQDKDALAVFDYFGKSNSTAEGL